MPSRDDEDSAAESSSYEEVEVTDDDENEEENEGENEQTFILRIYFAPEKKVQTRQLVLLIRETSRVASV